MAYYYYKEYNKLELHYWLKHESHIMDAFVQNRCEVEFLNLLLEIAETFKLEISILTEPLKEGGLRRIYNIISRQESNKAVIMTAVVTAIATAILVTPITTSLSKLTEIAIEKIFEDKETKNQLDEKTRLEILKLKQEIKLDSLLLDKNIRIGNRLSNFYYELKKSDNIEKISFVLYDEKRNVLMEEGIVDKDDFEKMQNYGQLKRITQQYLPKAAEKYLIEDSIEKNQTIDIEIISPDFSISSDKWKGLYKGKQINFIISDKDFNNFVQSGKTQFKKGSTINCTLKIEKISYRKIIYNVEKINSFV